MDEGAVRERAEAHGRATVSGDLKTAGADLDKSAYGAAGDLMKQMPVDLSASEVTEVREDGGQWVVSIRYSGASEAVTVESRWADRNGSPKIVDLKVK